MRAPDARRRWIPLERSWGQAATGEFDPLLQSLIDQMWLKTERGYVGLDGYVF